ncbi:hypothetical protein ACFX2I_004930 [Malus domestica]
MVVRDGRDKGHGVGRGNSTNQGLLKSLRMSHKISMEYVGIQPTASQKPPRRPEFGAPGSGSEWPSDSLALTDSKEMQMGGAQNALVIGPSAPRAQ